MHKFYVFLTILCLPTLVLAENQQPLDEIIVASVGCNHGPNQPKIPKTLDGIRALGKVQKESIKPTTDYGSASHLRATFAFDGMTLVLILDKNNNRIEFIEYASFSNSRWNKVFQIGVGSSILDYLKKEGVSKMPKNKTSVEICEADDGAPDCIKMRLKNYKIIQAEYECYTG